MAAPRKARKRSRRKKASGEVPASEDVQPEVHEPLVRMPAFKDFGLGIRREDLTEGLSVSTGPVAREVWPVAAVRDRPIIKQVNIKERRQKHLNSTQSIVNEIELNLAVRSDC